MSTLSNSSCASSTQPEEGEVDVDTAGGSHHDHTTATTSTTTMGCDVVNLDEDDVAEVKSLLSLPDTLLACVVETLPSRDALAVSGVCRRLRRVCHHLVNLDTFSFEFVGEKGREASITHEMVRSCLAQFQHVNTLSFAGCAELALTSLDGAPRTLRGLNLSSVYSGDSTWVIRIATLFSNLRALDVTDWDTDEDGLDLRPLAHGCPRLEALRCGGFGIFGLSDVVQACHHLRVLHVEDGSSLAGVGPMLSQLRSLRSLSLVCCDGFDEDDLVAVARVGKLHHLHIEPAPGVPPVVTDVVIMAFVEQCRELAWLDVFFSPAGCLSESTLKLAQDALGDGFRGPRGCNGAQNELHDRGVLFHAM